MFAISRAPIASRSMDQLMLPRLRLADEQGATTA